MASSKVMASRSQANRDHTRQPSPSPARLNLQSDQSRGFGSMNIDDILKNIYSDSESISGEGGNGESAMTLEDFLTKAGAVNEDDVRVSSPTDVFAKMSTATAFPAVQFSPAVGFGAEFASGAVAVSGGGGRGKRKAGVEDLPLDKATQQRQRRMIKNRESAARSRERKQAYTVELETLVTQLEEENARLLEEEAELNKERHKQLMENLIPVVEKRRPPRFIRRVHSMEW